MTRGQGGFSLPGVLAMLVVGLALAAAAYGSAAGGTRSSGQSRDGKQAYAAAEAGLNWYLSRLVYDNAFWMKCTSVAGPDAPVNDEWKPGTQTTDPRIWRALPDSSAEYTVELLAANGAQACSRANPAGTMIDAGTRAFRIRATGRFAGQKRSLVASFRRARFLDFLYLTEFETTDPLNYPVTRQAGVTENRTYALANCAGKLRPNRRTYQSSSDVGCTEIQFAAADVLAGPLRSNDSLMICGAATFGRTSADAIETSAAAPGYVKSPSGGCSASPRFRGTLRTGTSGVDMPESDAELQDAVQPAYRFTGTTTIVLKNTSIEVTGGGLSQRTTLPWPSNGLVYVQAGESCSSSQTPADMTYAAEPSGCANAYVSGTYGRNLTVASQRDVIVNGDVTEKAGADAVAGLIAGRFARVYHPVTRTPDSCDNAAGSLNDVTIEAAILAVSNSFTVDNYRCGPLGTLTVTGGIAQSYRGAVGTGATGYRKNYAYDDRFVYRNPPFFLEPSRAAWRIVRASEQSPAR